MWGDNDIEIPEKSFPSPINLHPSCLKPFPCFCHHKLLGVRRLTNFSLKDKHLPSNLAVTITEEKMYSWILSGNWKVLIYENNDIYEINI